MEKGKLILYIIVGLLLILFLSFIFGTLKTRYEVSKIRKELLKQIQDERAKYEKQIQEYQIQIEDLQKQLKLSEKRVLFYRNQYQSLEKKKQQIKPPSNERELYERFERLGYKPISK